MNNNNSNISRPRPFIFSPFRQLLNKKQKFDYCIELQQRKKEYASRMGRRMGEKLSERSQLCMDDVRQCLEENKDIWRLEKLEMQLQIDYWKSTCNHHMKRRRLTGAEGRALDMEHRELHAKFKRNLRKTRDSISESKERHEDQSKLREQKIDEVFVKFGAYQKTEDQKQEIEMRHDFNVEIWLQKKDRPDPAALDRNRMCSADIESSPEIISGDKCRSLESSDCETP